MAIFHISDQNSRYWIGLTEMKAISAYKRTPGEGHIIRIDLPTIAACKG